MNTIIEQAQLTNVENISKIFNAYRVFYQQQSDIYLARNFIKQRLISLCGSKLIDSA